MAATSMIGRERAAASPARLVGEALERVGRHGIRYRLVIVLVWVGAMVFTAHEAEAIQGSSRAARS